MAAAAGSAGGARPPEVDAGLDGVAVDGGQLVVAERGPAIAPSESSSWATLDAPMSTEVTRASRRHQASAIWASDWPRPAAMSLSAAHAGEVLIRQEVLRERGVAGGTRAGGHPAEVLGREHALGERREGDAAGAHVGEDVEQARRPRRHPRSSG